jgi:hypothetical protein
LGDPEIVLAAAKLQVNFLRAFPYNLEALRREALRKHRKVRLILLPNGVYFCSIQLRIARDNHKLSCGLIQ